MKTVETQSVITDGRAQRLPYRWGGASDKGKERAENEDAYHPEPEVGLFLVSDGMGGHRGGKLAAQIVVEDLPVMIETALLRGRSRSIRSVRSLLKRAITEQSRQLQMEGMSESGYKGMGATAVLVLLRQGRAYVANLGDSRAYRFRKGRLLQVSKDHSVVSELVDQGEIEPEEAGGHEVQGQITRYVGMDEKAKVYLRSFQLRRGDRLLLCTDGLTDMVEDKAISRVLKKETDPQRACGQLVRLANESGGHDNITVVAIDIIDIER